jgi:hypothetical protein
VIDSCAELARIFMDQNFNIFDNSSVLCMFVLYKLPEDDLKKFEIFWSFTGMYESVYVNTCAFVDFMY